MPLSPFKITTGLLKGALSVEKYKVETCEHSAGIAFSPMIEFASIAFVAINTNLDSKKSPLISSTPFSVTLRTFVLNEMV